MRLSTWKWRRSTISVTAAVLAIACYGEQLWAQRQAESVVSSEWMRPYEATQTSVLPSIQRGTKKATGLLDVVRIGGKERRDSVIDSDRYQEGLEVIGWLAPAIIRHRFFQPNRFLAVLSNDHQSYTFIGQKITRKDIARDYRLPTSDLGFHFRMNLDSLPPGHYRLRVERGPHYFSPEITIARH